jgi:DNA-binding MarR family transcriptional regulator
MSRRTKRQSRRSDVARELALGDYQLLAEFRYLLARFLAFSAEAAHAAGLAPRQHQALLAIKGHPGGAQMTVGDLAERLGIRHHSAVGLVDRLVDSGYLIRRRADDRDRRRAILSLTPSGEKALAALSAAHREELHRIAPLLGPLLSQLGLADPRLCPASPRSRADRSGDK